MSPADRIVSAVHDGDQELAQYIANSTRVRALRAAVIELANRVPPPEADPDVEVVRAVARRYEISVDLIGSKSQRTEVLRARQVTCYALYLLGATYSHIGRVIHRDHSTVMNAVARVGENPRLRAVAQQVAAEHGWDRNARDVG